MATIQQSIDVRAPIHTVYDRLCRFEDYPRFMDEVKNVQQLDDTHLHWTTVMANRPVEWDAEITEQETDRCIAWHNVSGPTNDGRVELQPVGQDTARIIFTLHTEPEQVPGSMAGNNEQAMALQLKLDMARLKDFIEGDEAQATMQSRASGQGAGQRQGLAESMQSAAAGSEGFTGDEEPAQPVTSSSRTAAEQRNDSAGSTQQTSSGSTIVQAGAMRHLGQMPQDTSTEIHGGAPTLDAMGAMSSPMTQATQHAQGRPEASAGQPAQNAEFGRAQHPAAAHAVGATDAEAGARLSGTNPPGTAQPHDAVDASQMSGGPSAAVGAAAAGGTGRGAADMGADAGDTRGVPRAGTTPAAGGTVSGSGKGGAKA